MNSRRIVVLVPAAAAAGLAALLVRGLIGGATAKADARLAPQPIAITDVLVAAKDLQPGSPLAAGHVRWQKWPTSSVDPNSSRVRTGLARRGGRRALWCVPRSSRASRSPTTRSSRAIRRLHGGDAEAGHARGLDSGDLGLGRRRLHPAQRSRRHHPDRKRPAKSSRSCVAYRAFRRARARDRPGNRRQEPEIRFRCEDRDAGADADRSPRPWRARRRRAVCHLALRSLGDRAAVQARPTQRQRPTTATTWTTARSWSSAMDFRKHRGREN